MNRSHTSKFALIATLAVATGLVQAQGQAALETSPTLPGAELAQTSMLSSERHKVVEPVKVENHFGKFVIESKFGKFTVRGVNMLGVRASELQAIEALQKVQQDDAFKDALSKSGSNIATFAESVVTDPGKTVENIGKGASTVMGRIGYLAQTGSNYVSDKTSDLTSKDKSEKPKTKAAPAGEPEPPSFIGDPFGYNMARREWAKKLNIDPYTSNPVLRPLLDKAASATFAGNFAVSLTVGMVIVPIQYSYELDNMVRQSVWNQPAIDIQKDSESKLLALGVEGRTVRNLLRNKWFTPTLQAALVARLEALGKIPGIESVVAAAAATQGETRARFLLESLAILAGHHQKTGKLAKIRMSNLVPVGITADGGTVAAIAIDYATWDKDAAAFVQRKELASAKKTLLVAGKISPRARQEMEKAGWSVKERQRG
jgi:hypothetical protein